MNETRSIWAFHGLTGYFIAVALLLSILAFLTYEAITTQAATAHQGYEIKNPLTIQRIGSDLSNETHVIVHGTPVGGDVKHKYQFESK